jgi:hypothetical protein
MNQEQHTELAQTRPLKAIVSGSAGNLMVCYDWHAYSAFSYTSHRYLKTFLIN